MKRMLGYLPRTHSESAYSYRVQASRNAGTRWGFEVVRLSSKVRPDNRTRKSPALSESRQLESRRC